MRGVLINILAKYFILQMYKWVPFSWPSSSAANSRNGGCACSMLILFKETILINVRYALELL